MGRAVTQAAGPANPCAPGPLPRGLAVAHLLSHHESPAPGVTAAVCPRRVPLCWETGGRDRGGGTAPSASPLACCPLPQAPRRSGHPVHCAPGPEEEWAPCPSCPGPRGGVGTLSTGPWAPRRSGRPVHWAPRRAGPRAPLRGAPTSLLSTSWPSPLTLALKIFP